MRSHYVPPVSHAAFVSSQSTAQQWRIVLARDRRFDGAFVYAVRSTGIFCRPSCPSRRPRRSVVRFFPIPEAAQAAGFRACRRCRPTQTPSPDPAVALVRDLCRAIDAQPDRAADLATLGRRVGRSPHQLLRAFRRVLGVSPREYRDARRLARLKSSLKERRHVSPAIYEAGYGSSSRVYERAATALGMTPASYGRGGRGATIRYAVVPSPLGQLLVAATDKGVCRISLGDAAAPLERDLRTEFPAATITPDRSGLTAWVQAIAPSPRRPRAPPRLAARYPGDGVPTTRVGGAQADPLWRHAFLQGRGAGDPSARGHACRGAACATNPVAIAIPCHRVVREDGALGGYHWGIERKRRLLQREASY